MSFDTKLFTSKLNELINLQGLDLVKLSEISNIERVRLTNIIEGTTEPLGDEVLILADSLNQDFRYLISNSVNPQIKKTEKLFRLNGDILSKEDKRMISEVLLMATNYKELSDLKEINYINFLPKTRNRIHKYQGQEAAVELRNVLGYSDKKNNVNPFEVARSLGIQVFRRSLNNSNISGIHLNNVNSGKVIIVNYDDDIYRQNFTVLHELAHSIFDIGTDFSIDYENHNNDEEDKYKEYRANNFASYFLVPPNLAKQVITSYSNDSEFINIANQVRVNPSTLSIVLKENGLISDLDVKRLKKLKIKLPDKVDPELYDLSPKSKERVKILQSKGISLSYYRLAKDSYDIGEISYGKMCEILRINTQELNEIISEI